MTDKYITAFAPASIGNVGVGFDMLGLAIENVGDRVSARKTEEKGVRIKEIYDLNGDAHSSLSKNTNENTASISASSLWESQSQSCGLELVIHKGIPLQSGMGSSAASAVAGAVAANALLENPLSKKEILMYALDGEKFASGGLHADNVAPSLFGGLVFCPQNSLPVTSSIKMPDTLSSIVLHPELKVNTAESRLKLKKNYSLDVLLEQQSYLAGFVLGVIQNDITLIRENLRDILIEPQRASDVPCFKKIQEIALNNGALGCSISGSGPSIFAICENNKSSQLEGLMRESCLNQGYDCQTWISQSNSKGSTIED